MTGNMTYPNLVKFSNWYGGIHGYLSIAVCSFGIVANIFNVVVLSCKNMVTPTNVILLGLAVSDLLTMLSYIPFALHFYILYPSPPMGSAASPERNSQPWVKFFLFHAQFTITSHTISIWLGVLLSIFRYVYVKASNAGKVPCGINKARITTVCVSVFAVIILIPNYICLRILPKTTPDNQTYYDLETPHNGSDVLKHIAVLNFWTQALLVKIIPCALMTVFGGLLLLTLRDTGQRTSNLRRSNNSNTNQNFKRRMRNHTRTTRMLIMVIVLFLVTELPQGILSLISGLNPSFFDNIYVPLGDIMDIVALINFGINFVLYCSMSKSFRDCFVKIFCAIDPSLVERIGNSRGISSKCQIGSHQMRPLNGHVAYLSDSPEAENIPTKEYTVELLNGSNGKCVVKNEGCLKNTML
ncbi:unnamed protein product [Owenia fusiformis]|uniref:Uncharacterized protein n=1 Tax=Owenia fusiformis TaxID=6347 RepID=A0A8J1TXE1_OWEFU|nr:unnamed protein product [Owenia fusiformis]